MSLLVPIENALSVGASVSPSLMRKPRKALELEIVIVVGTLVGKVAATKESSTISLPRVTMKPPCERAPVMMLELVKCGPPTACGPAAQLPAAEG
jgi:hypothetical protein